MIITVIVVAVKDQSLKKGSVSCFDKIISTLLHENDTLFSIHKVFSTVSSDCGKEPFAQALFAFEQLPRNNVNISWKISLKLENMM